MARSVQTQTNMVRLRSSETAIRFAPEPVAKTPEPQIADVLEALAHDLRNPLGTITLGTSLLLDQHEGEPRTRRSLEMVQRAAHHIQDLLERMTDLSSILTSHLQLEIEEVTAADLIASVVDHKPVIVDPGADTIRVRCDKHRAGEVIAMAVGERLRGNGESVRIRTKVQAKTHGLFVVSHAATLRSFEYALAHGIIAAHGGELWIEGTSVLFTLPLAS
jgi:signal transduction histidine kinase